MGEHFQEYLPEEALGKEYLYEVFHSAIIDNINKKRNEKIEELIDEGVIDSKDEYNYYEIKE